jgi:uncharacterized protein (DUF885 family)
MKKILSMMALSVIAGCSQPPVEQDTKTIEDKVQVTTATSESERLNQWFETKYEESLQFSPLTMTSLGRKDKYDEIDDLSVEAQDKRLAWQAASVKELMDNFDYDQLDDDTKISYNLWLFQYEQAQAQVPFRQHGYVFTQMQGGHTQLPNLLINFHKVNNESDMQAYISRISGVGTAISQLLEQAQSAAEIGIRAPYFAYDGVITQSQNIITGAPFEESETDSPLLADAKAKIKQLLADEKIDLAVADHLTLEATNALLGTFHKSYVALIDWFEADLVNVSEQAFGVGALPDGEAYYNAALKNHTTTDMTATQVHNLGLAEVARIRKEMDELKKRVEFTGDLSEFFTYIKSEPSNQQFYYPDTDEGRQGYLDDSTAYLDYIKQQLPNYFGILPKADLVVKRVEAFRERPGAAQHYFPGTPDGTRPGVYYAHLSDMTAMPKNEMEAIAYHEGNPGHHMQLSIAQELEGVPQFRTQAFFTSYIEGWALYSELLAKEMGAYQNPYTDFGRLVTEIWRAIRLVVDTGIHTKGWSEQDAIDYFKANSPVAETQIISEVRRYITWPGQATSYKIGMLKILELREKAKNKLGDKFEIKDFHDTVLGGGSLPLPVLEQVVNSWIDEQSKN